MIPSSFNRTFRTGRLRQEALLAEAERERRAMRAVAEALASTEPAAPTAGTAPPPRPQPVKRPA